MRQFPWFWLNAFLVIFASFVFGAFSLSLVFAEDETASDKVKQANDLAVIVVKRAAGARETCYCEMEKEVLESANKAAVLLSEAVAEAEKTGQPCADTRCL